MPLLGTYTFAGAASLAAVGNCFAHSLPTTPDWAVCYPVGPITGGAGLSIPLIIATRGATIVGVNNPNPGVNAELVAQFVHSISR